MQNRDKQLKVNGFSWTENGGGIFMNDFMI